MVEPAALYFRPVEKGLDYVGLTVDKACRRRSGRCVLHFFVVYTAAMDRIKGGSDMQIETHKAIDQALCGKPLLVEKDYSKVELATTAQMAADQKGLTHGGFIFGLADYADMIAVNHPNVVLGAAETKFLKPVQTGDMVIAEAKVGEQSGKKRIVEVRVTKDKEAVFVGTFTCFVLEQHVLT